jgi:putative DNA primase/helicase
MATPYQVSALGYFEAGWSPIPLPFKQKFPVPDGTTGEAGRYMDRESVEGWVRPKARANAGKLNYPPGNVALRLPRTVLGIDVDAYGDKKGEETLARAEMEWGALPPTWVTTSKDDGISGIRLFGIPEGLEWPGELPQGKGVELIRWDHRFAIVAPSIHDKTGDTYGWKREEEVDGEVEMVDSPEEFPSPGDIVALPKEWVEGLTSGVKWKERAVSEDLSADDIQEWLECRPDPRKICTAMRATVTKYTREIRQASDDGGAHDEGRNAVWAVLGDAKAGHTGVVKALTELRNVFLAAVADRRPDTGTARKEWARAVARGIKKVDADDNPDVDDDPCVSIRSLKPKREDGRLGSNDRVYRYDEIGNAERLLRVMNGRARWVESYKSWYIWEEGKAVWRLDNDRQIDRWCVKAINQISEEAEYEDDEKNLAAIKKFAKSSSTSAMMNNMQKIVRGRAGIIVPAETFDADPKLIGCANGVLELKPDGVGFRRGREGDYLTLNTGVDFRPAAKHELWDDYLKRFQPDEEVRAWLQMLVGYSLFGRNPEQLLVVGLGKTSTGKTTITEGLLAALGGYAGPLEASLLRSNADDKPRPDILKALPRRIVIAEELSEFQHLHVDQVKRITGAGTLSARGMAANVFVERAPAFTPWLMTNETPTIEGADAALKNRVLVVPFDVQMPRNRVNANTRERILKEALPAILAWAVAGWEAYVGDAVDLRAVPAGALAAQLQFSAEMSDFHQFLSVCCDAAEDYHEIPMALYSAYETWCLDNGVKDRDVLSVNKFGRRLMQMGYEKGKKTINGKQVDVRLGVRLTAETSKNLQ